MNIRSLSLALFLLIAPTSAWAGPWSLGAEAGPMVWLFKEAPVSYAMTLTPGYEVLDGLILETTIGIRHYSFETPNTETATFALPLMVGARYLTHIYAGLSFVSGLHLGGLLLLEDDMNQGAIDQSAAFKPGGRVVLGLDYQLMDTFALGLTGALEITADNLFVTTGIGGRVEF
jgi:hypothetical protein